MEKSHFETLLGEPPKRVHCTKLTHDTSKLVLVGPTAICTRLMHVPTGELYGGSLVAKPNYVD